MKKERIARQILHILDLLGDGEISEVTARMTLDGLWQDAVEAGCLCGVRAYIAAAQ